MVVSSTTKDIKGSVNKEGLSTGQEELQEPISDDPSIEHEHVEDASNVDDSTKREQTQAVLQESVLESISTERGQSHESRSETLFIEREQEQESTLSVKSAEKEQLQDSTTAVDLSTAPENLEESSSNCVSVEREYVQESSVLQDISTERVHSVASFSEEKVSTERDDLQESRTVVLHSTEPEQLEEPSSDHVSAEREYVRESSVSLQDVSTERRLLLEVFSEERVSIERKQLEESTTVVYLSTEYEQLEESSNDHASVERDYVQGSSFLEDVATEKVYLSESFSEEKVSIERKQLEESSRDHVSVERECVQGSSVSEDVPTERVHLSESLSEEKTSILREQLQASTHDELSTEQSQESTTESALRTVTPTISGLSSLPSIIQEKDVRKDMKSVGGDVSTSPTSLPALLRRGARSRSSTTTTTMTASATLTTSTTYAATIGSMILSTSRNTKTSSDKADTVDVVHLSETDEEAGQSNTDQDGSVLSLEWISDEDEDTARKMRRSTWSHIVLWVSDDEEEDLA